MRGESKDASRHEQIVYAAKDLNAFVVIESAQDVPRAEDEIETLRLQLADLAQIHVGEPHIGITRTRQRQHRRRQVDAEIIRRERREIPGGAAGADAEIE